MKLKDDLKNLKNISVKDLKGQVFRKSNLKNAYFWGFLLAALCLFLVVIVPLTITNNEVKEAKAAAAAEAQRAFEEAKAAALEAERKAEEERLLALNSALAEERAAQAKAEEERIAAEKAAAERQALIEEISKQTFETVNGIVSNQMEEDFSTQYSIQDNLIDTQNETVKFIQAATTVITTTIDGVNTTVDSVKENVSDIKTFIEEKDAQEKAAAAKHEKEVMENHYNRKNHVDLYLSSGASTFDFVTKDIEYGNTLFGASYVHNFDAKFGLGLAVEYDLENGLFAQGLVEFKAVDELKLNVSVRGGVGAQYDAVNNKFYGAFSVSVPVRYTAVEGYELAVMPTALVMPMKGDSTKAIFMPVTLGLSFTF